MTALDLPFPVRNSAPTEAQGMSSHRFKDALARLAGGLAIVTCWDQGAAQGLLVSSITGLSVDPPRYLFCVRREAAAHGALVNSSRCAVNLLSVDDEGEALTFIDPSLRAQRFVSPRWRHTGSYPPILKTALTQATCLVDTVMDAGGHSILLATAQTLEIRSGEPLLSYNRNLRRLHPQAGEAGW